MMTMSKEFAVFILSHGRADTIKTVKMLEDYNYTGDWYVVIDDVDDQEDLYRKKFGDHVLQFNKQAVADRTDTGDLDNYLRVGVFARNAIIDFAKQLGYEYHLQLDDDFTRIDARFPRDGKNLATEKIPDLDCLFAILFEYMKNTPIVSLSFSLSSDHVGGFGNNKYRQGMFRKTMGSFLLKTEEAPYFIMRMNDDVTTSMLYGNRGLLYFSLSVLQVATPPTQHEKGGMTQAYLDMGTYRKSFYSVMALPSAVQIATQGVRFKRIHHHISWNNCSPCVLSERWKK